MIIDDPYQEMDDSGKRVADAIQKEIDDKVIKEILDILRKEEQVENYDRAMKGIL